MVRHSLPAALFALMFVLVCSLLGCSTVSPSTSSTHVTAVVGIQGRVHGGQQPVAGSLIELYTVGTTGDGSPSQTLLTSTTRTDANGNFNLTGLYSCANATDVYVTATGGQPLTNTTNPNLALMTSLGSCSGLQPSTFITINEVTTVAAVSALAPFMSSSTSIGSSSADVQALQAAFTTAAQYADSSAGTSPGHNLPQGWTAPTQLIYTLANILAACVNSTGGTANDGSNCGNLFASATLNGGASPTDTTAAMLNIILDSTANTQALFSLAGASGPFQPTLTSAPSDFRPHLTATAQNGDGIQISPYSLAFPNSELSTASVPLSVTLTNLSSATQTLATPTLFGTNIGDFSIGNNCSGSLTSGTSCSVSVTATPLALGVRTAFLRIASSSADSPEYVALSVNGVADVNGIIRVNGNRLTRNGMAWNPHGLNFIAFVQPPAAQPGGCNNSTSTNYQTAYNRYLSEGSALFTNLVSWGGDTIRFQVSQMGIDSGSSLYSQVFFNYFVQAVRQARAAGLNVIISIQDECQSGDVSPASEPGPETRSDWSVLAPIFSNDLGIMFEMYNEPEPAANTSDWQSWQIAHNNVINVIRGAGAANVVIADGLAYATTLSGAPNLTDPNNQVAYGVHPYFHQANLTPSFWDTNFGDFAESAPVIDTEWTAVANSATSGSSYYCDANTPSQSLALMQYQQSKNIGMVGFAWDFTGTVFGSIVYYVNSNSTTYKTSSFTGNNCGDSGYGPGLTMQQWFLTGTVPSSPQ